LEDNGFLDASLYECAALLTQFDSHSQGSLSYEDFLLMTLPLRDYELREKVAAKDLRAVVSGRLSSDIEVAFSRLVLREVDLIREMNLIRDELRQEPDFTPLIAFNHLDL
jgi:hypothetical protein